MCVVHVVLRYVGGMQLGNRVFTSISARTAIDRLRERMRALQAVNWASFRLHDFRRGHAQDMLERGVGLAAILLAGDWRSSAFMSYLDTADLQARAVLEAATQVDSASEDEGTCLSARYCRHNHFHL